MRFMFAAFLFASLTQFASAATVSIVTQATSRSLTSSAGQEIDRCDQTNSSSFNSCSSSIDSDNGLVFVSVGGSGGSSVVQQVRDFARIDSSTTVDTETGVLRASTSVDSTREVANGIVAIEVEQRFRIDGEVSFGMSYDLSWMILEDEQRFTDFTVYGHVGVTNLGGLGDTDNFRFSDAGIFQTDLVGSNEGVLSATVATQPGNTQTVIATWVFRAVLEAPGEIDFSNTGLMFVEAASGGSFETIGDPTFLSQQAFGSDPPQVVPLPGAASLFLAALTILGVAARRARR